MIPINGDGWRVKRMDFAPTATDVEVKNWVTNQYNLPNASVKSLLIIGHLAIPYSGNYAPDGHAERIGAQPADVFYADIDGNWTDESVTTNNTGLIYTPNIPDDGYWDQNAIPSQAEIEVGRIDLFNMTGFTLSDADLIKQYLNKNHAYRHKITTPQQRALINTHLDNQLPATSAVGWRSFSPIVGSQYHQTNTLYTHAHTFILLLIPPPPPHYSHIISPLLPSPPPFHLFSISQYCKTERQKTPLTTNSPNCIKDW